MCGYVQGTVDILGQMLAGSLLFFIFRQQTSAFYFTQARPLHVFGFVSVLAGAVSMLHDKSCKCWETCDCA
jgi:hypothetical protein